MTIKTSIVFIFVCTWLLSSSVSAQDGDGLEKLLKIIKKDQKRVDEYECLIHTDWIDLKLANYVLKIELIRVRNAAMFHPLLDGVKIKTIYPR